jgi:hypothetical protein
LAAEGGSDQPDSDWAVGTPSTAVPAAVPADEPQKVLHRTLEVHAPAMMKPVALQNALEQSEVGSTRYVSQPNGVAGWRPASQPLVTHKDLPAPVVAPP